MLEYSDQFGLAGTIVSAVLQGAGLFTLSDILTQAAPVFERLGVLLFVVTVVMALTRLANGGELRDALMLLLGPILFLAVFESRISVQVVTDNASKDTDSLVKGIRSIIGEGRDDKAIDVPIVFWVFDRFTTDIVQMTVNLLQSDNFQQATIQAARDRVMSRILNSDEADPNFLMLITLSLSGECAEIVALDWDLAQPQYKNAPAGSLDAAVAAQKIAKRDYLIQKNQKLPQTVFDYLGQNGIAATLTPTCDEVWQYSRTLADAFATSMLSLQSPARKDFPELTDLQFGAVLDFVKAKLAPADADPAEYAEAYRVLAAFLLRNSSGRTAHGAMSSMFDGRPDWMLTQEPDQQMNAAQLEQTLDSARIVVARFAASVPYVQGLCLYLLTVSFPFFCLLLILPQRMTSVLTWMGLWIWVKSWDIGFAIVGNIREIVWQFVPNTSDILGVTSLNDVDWADPATMFSVLNADSPELQFQTYFGLIAMLTLAVPVLMGYCFQAASAMADIISRGFAHGVQK